MVLSLGYLYIREASWSQIDRCRNKPIRIRLAPLYSAPLLLAVMLFRSLLGPLYKLFLTWFLQYPFYAQVSCVISSYLIQNVNCCEFIIESTTLLFPSKDFTLTLRWCSPLCSIAFYSEYIACRLFITFSHYVTDLHSSVFPSVNVLMRTGVNNVQILWLICGCW